jgi:hypothetical protein
MQSVERRAISLPELAHVHEANLFDAHGKIETQPMRRPSTAIVGTNEELFVPKMAHCLNLVQCHCSERVVEVQKKHRWRSPSVGRLESPYPCRSGT